MAVDLREIVAAIRVSGDLERVGDLAKNIAKRTMMIATEPRVARASVGLRHMNELAALQLKDVLDAYAQRDPERAAGRLGTRRRTRRARGLACSAISLTFMMEDPRNISFCTHLLFCSKNIERVGDHATNIAETVVYLATGEALPVDRPEGPQGYGADRCVSSSSSPTVSGRAEGHPMPSRFPA